MNKQLKHKIRQRAIEFGVVVVMVLVAYGFSWLTGQPVANVMAGWAFVWLILHMVQDHE